nr:peptidoglycan DD-metalloendopeptidase family protein [Actinomycetales bacterium]
MRRRIPSALLAAALAAALGLAAPALADDRDSLVDQLSQNEAELESLRSSLEGVDVSLQQTYLDLQATQNQIPVVEAQFAQAVEDLAAAERTQQAVADRLAVAEAELSGIESEIAESQGRISESEESLATLARTTYQNGGANQNPVSLIFGSTSSDDFLTQYTALDSAVRSQTAVLDEMSELEATKRNAEARQDAVLVRVVELKEEADRAVSAAEDARATAAAKRQEVLDLEALQSRLAADLEGQKSSIEGQQAVIQQDNDSLGSRIAEIDAENRRKAEAERQRKAEEEAERQRRAEEEAERQRQADAQAESSRNNSGSSGSSKPAPAPTTQAPAPAPSTSSFVTPVPRPLHVTSPYGYRVYPITGGWFMHYGVDLRSACGNRQSAVAGGTISDVRGAYGNGTHGNQVIINHGMINGSSWVSVYNHLSSFAVSRGQSVSQGQAIGYTGATGNVTGCHVHLELWKDGRTIDPMTVY